MAGVDTSQLIGITGQPLTGGPAGVTESDLTQETERSTSERVYDLVTKAPPLALASFVDTVGQSFGLIEDGFLQDTLNEYLPTYGDYYQRNKEWIKMAGDITGMFIPGTIAMKGFQTGSYLLKTMKVADNRLIRSLLHSGKSEDEVIRGVRYFDRYLATNRGMFAGRDFTNESFVRSGVGGLTQKLGRADFTRRAFTTNVSDVMKNSVAFELGAYATMNQSDVLYPDDFDMIDAGVLAGLGIALPGGIEYFVTRNAIKNSMRSSIREFANQTLAENQDLIAATLNGLNRGATFDTPGNRGDLISIYKILADKEQIAADTSSNTLLRTNFNADIQELNTLIDAQIGKAMQDKFPGLQVSKRSTNDQVRSTVFRGLEDDPLLLNGLQTIEEVPSTKKGIEEFLKGIDTAKNTNRKMIEALKLQDPDGDLYATEVAQLEKQFKSLDDMHAVVLGTDGSLISARNYTPRWLDTHTVKDVKIQKGGQDESSIYHVVVETQDGNGEYQKIGFTLDGFVVAPQPKTRVITQKNEVLLPAGFVRVLDPSNVRRAENENKMLDFIADNYQFGKGALYQKHVRPRLSTEVARALDNFIQGVEMGNQGKVKTWLENWTPEAQEIYDAHAEIRRALYDLRSEGMGAIKLYRVETIKALRNPSSDIASYSSDARQALKFMGPDKQLVERWVAIDDIVAPIGGLNEREFLVRNNKNRILSVGDDGKVKVESTVMEAGGNEAIQNLTFNVRSALYGTIQKALQNFPNSKKEIYLSTNDHWTRWEYALALAEKGGDDVKKRIHWPKEIQVSGEMPNTTSVESFILNRKYQELAVIMKQQEAASQLGAAFTKGALSKDDIAYLLNLPHDEFGNVHPTTSKLFEHVAHGDGVEAVADVYKSAQAWKRNIQETQGLPDVVAYKEQREIAFRGNNFQIRDGRPALLLRRNLDPADNYSRKAMIERATVRRELVLSKLLNQEAPALIRNVARSLLINPEEYLASTRVDNLVEGSQTSRGVITSQAHVGWDNPTLGPLSRLMAMAARATEEEIGKIFEPFITTFNKIKSSSNRGSLESFNIAAQSLRYRWNVADDAEEVFEGITQLRLVNDKSTLGKQNREKWKEFFGEDIEIGQPLFLPTMVKGRNYGLPVGLTPDAMDTLNAFRDLTAISLQNNNYTRSLVGLGEINYRNYYIPPITLRGNESAYILRADGAPKQIVVGRNQNELNQKIAKLREEGDIVVTQETAERYFDLQDQAFGGMIDYGRDALLQTGKRARGTLGSELVETGTNNVDNIIQTINDQLHSAARRVRALAYESQLNYAKAAKNASGVQTGKVAPSIYDTYAQMVWGSQAINRGNVVGQVYGAIENTYDIMLQGAMDKAGLLKSARIDSSDRKAYEDIKKQLGDYNPFKDVADYVENTFRATMPVSMKKDMAKLSALTSTLTLRFLEVGHSVLTLTSLAATMPAVIRAMNRMPGEQEIDWANRIGSVAARWGQDGKVPAFSPARATASAAHFMFTEEGRNVWREAVKRGYFTQDVAEMMRTITAPQEGYTKGLIRRYGSIMNKLSDRTEELARGMAFMTGYNLAKTTKILNNNENMLSFAYDFANKVIGDYRPNNRPQIFQGAVGMPLGLFQTFTWNYMQRLFGYIQNRQYRALATQYGMQALTFGAKSVPGFDLFTEQFASNYDGTTDPVTALERALPQGVADFLLYGSISNIPKIWGGQGVALYTRGTVDPRVPTLLNPSASPIANMAKETFNMVNESIDQFRRGGQFSTQRQMEIIGTYFINRPVANFMDVLADTAVDRRGNVINEDTQELGSIAARLLGSKPLTEAKEEAAYRRQRNTEFARAEIRGRLNDSFRSLIREGNLTEDTLSDILRDYYDSGGTPAGFVQWLRNSMVTASVNRMDIKMRDLMGSGKVEDVMRLINSRALNENDPDFE